MATTTPSISTPWPPHSNQHLQSVVLHLYPSYSATRRVSKNLHRAPQKGEHTLLSPSPCPAPPFTVRRKTASHKEEWLRGEGRRVRCGEERGYYKHTQLFLSSVLPDVSVGVATLHHITIKYRPHPLVWPHPPPLSPGSLSLMPSN